MEKISLTFSLNLTIQTVSFVLMFVAFSALTLLVQRQEEHLACKK